MNKIYNIFLDGRKIGITELEKADSPMGVAYGQIKFEDLLSGYKLFKQYCLDNKIEFTDPPEVNLILTNNIPNLKVIDKAGIEIKGIGTNVSGMDSDTFDITVIGIPYPFYEEEFPHHVEAYNSSFGIS